MARRKGRAPEEFSMSFLDVICCGFGAIILLLMITKTVEPQIIEASTVNLEGKLAKLTEQVFELRGETKILNRDLNAKHRAVVRAGGEDRDTARAERQREVPIRQPASGNREQRGHCRATVYRKTGTDRGDGAPAGTDHHKAKNQLIGGIPVDSEYIISLLILLVPCSPTPGPRY